jgi:hypothetical protein
MNEYQDYAESIIESQAKHIAKLKHQLEEARELLTEAKNIFKVIDGNLNHGDFCGDYSKDSICDCGLEKARAYLAKYSEGDE